MLTISLKEDMFSFRDIAKEDLENVLKLYNQNEINIYATGIDRPMSIDDIVQKYLEVLINTHEFFVGIFLEPEGCKDERMIGVLKGRLEYENNEEAWLSSILIDCGYQRNGMGTKAVEVILKMLKNTYDIKMVMIGILSSNTVGRNFWEKLGFSYVRTIDQYIKLNQKTEDFIIMKKDLNK